jgi:hypothetical protein
MQRRTDSFRLNPITLGAVVAGLIAFVITGGLTVLMWVALAASIGAGVGWVVHRVSTQANAYATVEELSEHATRAELEAEAANLGVEGRSSMSKDELTQAIAQKLAS